MTLTMEKNSRKYNQKQQQQQNNNKTNNLKSPGVVFTFVPIEIAPRGAKCVFLHISFLPLYLSRWRPFLIVLLGRPFIFFSLSLSLLLLSISFWFSQLVPNHRIS